MAKNATISSGATLVQHYSNELHRTIYLISPQLCPRFFGQQKTYVSVETEICTGEPGVEGSTPSPRPPTHTLPPPVLLWTPHLNRKPKQLFKNEESFFFFQFVAKYSPSRWEAAGSRAIFNTDEPHVLPSTRRVVTAGGPPFSYAPALR